MGYRLMDLKHDYNFEAFFPIDHPETSFYDRHRQQFGSDNDFVFLAIKPKGGVFDQSFLFKVDQLSKALDALPLVEKVVSPTNLIEFRKYDLYPALVEVPAIHWQDTSLYHHDSLKLQHAKGYLSRFLSEDGKSILLFIKHRPYIEEDVSQDFAHQLRDIVAAYNFSESHMAGRVVGQTLYIDLVREETLIFVASSFLLLLLFLYFTYRSFWGIWMPLTVVGFGVLWTLAIMTMLGKPLDIISNVLPTIIMVIGLSDVVHLTTHFLRERDQVGDDVLSNSKALIKSAKEVGLATFLTTLTTLIGFMTLLSSGVRPMMDLGIYASLGLLVAFALTYTWYFALLNVIPIDFSKRRNVQRQFWDAKLARLYAFIIKQYKPIVWVSLGIALLAFVGMNRVEQNSFIMDDLREDHEQKVAFRFFEDNFQGARPFELAVWSKDSTVSLFSFEKVQQLDSIETYLQKEYGVDIQESLPTFLKELNQVLHGGDSRYFKIPTSEKAFNKLLKEIRRNKKRLKTASFMTSKQNSLRFSGTVGDWGSKKINKANLKLDSFLSGIMEEHALDHQITGAAHLVDLNTMKVSNNVLEGLTFAIGVIALIVGLLFRSLK